MRPSAGELGQKPYPKPGRAFLWSVRLVLGFYRHSGHINVGPGRVVDKVLEERGGRSHTAPASARVLDVRCLRLDALLVFGEERHRPDLFRRRLACCEEGVAQFVVGAEETRGHPAQSNNTGPSQCGYIDDCGRLIALSIDKGIGQEHPAFGVGTYHLDSDAIASCHHFLWSVGVAADHIITGGC